MSDQEESATLISTPAIGQSTTTHRRIAPANTFSALRHRNFRLYFFGHFVALTGTWMQNVAQSWLVYQLTGSPLYLGIVSFASSIPVLAFSLGAGVFVDRVPIRWLLMRTQTAAKALAFILAADVFLGWVQPWHVVILAFLLGIVNTFDAPARQSFVIEMVGREDLTNAIALNSANFNSARIFGPTIAGILLALVGPAWCFFLNGLSLIPIVIALKMMKLQDKVAVEEKSSTIAQAREGLSFIRHNQTVRTLLIMVAVSNIFAVGYMSLMPAFAQDVLGVGPAGLGFLSAALGAGALIGALVIASLGKSQSKGLYLTAGNLFLPIMVLIFSTSTVFPLSLIIIFFAGIGFMVQNSMTNTLIQIAVPDHLRGRVMSVFTLVFMGFFPIGALLAGTVAEHSTIPLGAAFGGSIALLFGFIWLWRAPYIRKLT